MIFIIIGCLGYIFLIIFDLNKLKQINKYLNITFALGIVTLVLSTIGIVIGDFPKFEISTQVRLLAGVISAIPLIIMFFGLFFALPFKNTYTDLKNTNQVIDTGVYALCRHPGVVWFPFVYLFLWLATAKMMMLWAGIIWTIMDVIHVYIQDRWFFPRTFIGYDTYKSKVPFLIPTKDSIKKCIAYYFEKP